jgi:MOSC domain-containing protein YiiM
MLVLERLLEREGIHDALIHRGGLRARVVTNGKIGVGDRLVPEPSTEVEP